MNNMADERLGVFDGAEHDVDEEEVDVDDVDPDAHVYRLAEEEEQGAALEKRAGFLGTANTGPKGVIADYQDAKLQVRAKRLKEKLMAERHQRAEEPLLGPVQEPELKNGGSDGEENEEEDEDEAAELLRMRMERLQAIREAVPTYGNLVEVDIHNFLHVVDSVSNFQYAVVHLYKAHIEPCVRLNLALAKIAKKFPLVCFAKMIVTKAVPQYDNIGLPALVIFKGQKQEHTLVALTRDLGVKFSDQDVVDFLASFGVFDAITIGSVEKVEGDVKKDKPVVRESKYRVEWED